MRSWPVKSKTDRSLIPSGREMSSRKLLRVTGDSKN